ncbi:MAG: two-component regulator propeller domain-containing protein [Bacteroidia bacterium]
MHLPYKKCKYVTGSNTYVWSATENGLFRVRKSDNSVDRITKLEGLSDLTIGTIGYNSYNNVLFVGYANGNVDLIKGDQIINLSDIKRAQIVGSKYINNVYFIGRLAYVSTGFGIVVIDTDREEVKETYLIGPNGSTLEVYDITSDATTIYASTATGVYYANLNDPYLTNFANWNRFNGIPYGPYNTLELYNNKLLVNYSGFIQNQSFYTDTLYQYDFSTAQWAYVPGWNGGHITKEIEAQGATLWVADAFTVFKYDNNYTTLDVYYTVGNNVFIYPNSIYADPAGFLWVADNELGLLKMPNPFYGEIFSPNGPATTSTFSLRLKDKQLVVTPGGRDDAWNNVFSTEGVSIYRNSIWSIYNRRNTPALDTAFDILCSEIDPADPNHIFYGSWGEGLLETRNNNVVSVYDNSNSPLQSKVEYQWVGIGGLQYDENGNLWMTNSHTTKCLKMLKPDGTWYQYDFNGYIPSGSYVSSLTLTSSGQKWMVLPRGGGILVFDDNGTPSNFSDDKKKKLLFTQGNGAIPGSEAICVTEDKDGEIWIGTDKGIGVFYCAENIFTSQGCDAQQILIDQGGYIQILLESETVTCIAVDGANRKWIGTEGGGVFLMSDDGTKEILHFTIENSPLLSNNITCLAIDPESGEVYIGTDKGLVTYRGEATEGGDEMGDVYAFPNPVKPDYTGAIAIKGLVKDADVKITDIRGQVVYQTKALGGQAVWDGKNFKGERAATGVYLVFITNDDGTQTAVTKILFVN